MRRQERHLFAVIPVGPDDVWDRVVAVGRRERANLVMFENRNWLDVDMGQIKADW